MSRRLDDVRLALMMIDGERLGRALGSSEREMESELALTPLQPREFFGTPWSGEGEWTPRPWLCWLPGPRRFRFRSFTSWLTDELWLVHDTTIWEDGREERRDGLARLVAADRIRFTYDDMPRNSGSTPSPGCTYSLHGLPKPPGTLGCPGVPSGRGRQAGAARSMPS